MRALKLSYEQLTPWSSRPLADLTSRLSTCLQFAPPPVSPQLLLSEALFVGAVIFSGPTPLGSVLGTTRLCLVSERPFPAQDFSEL